MSEHVRVDEAGGLLAVILTGPTGATRSRWRCMRARRRGRKRRRRSRIPADLDPRRGPGPHLGQRPCRFPAAMPRDEEIPVMRLLGRWRATPSRWSPRCRAMRSASARPCCSTATWSSPTKAPDSRCRSSIWGWCRKRRARCCCRASPAAGARRAGCCLARLSGRRKRASSGSPATSSPMGSEQERWAKWSGGCLPSRRRRCKSPRTCFGAAKPEGNPGTDGAGKRAFRGAAEDNEVESAITAFFDRKPQNRLVGRLDLLRPVIVIVGPGKNRKSVGRVGSRSSSWCAGAYPGDLGAAPAFRG